MVSVGFVGGMSVGSCGLRGKADVCVGLRGGWMGRQVGVSLEGKRRGVVRCQAPSEVPDFDGGWEPEKVRA